MKKEKCVYCGQVVDRSLWLKNAKRNARKQGLPSLAKLLGFLEVKPTKKQKIK